MNGKHRDLALNIFFAVLFVGGLWWLAAATLGDFEYNWSFKQPLSYMLRSTEDGWAPGLLLEGFLMTLRLALWGGVACTLFGLAVALLSSSRIMALRMLGNSYVEGIRNMPPLVFIFVIYFFVSTQVLPPSLVSSIGDTIESSATLTWMFGPANLVENFLAGLLTIALYEAAYVAEIFRGGIQSIGKGQWEASSALGLRRWPAMRLVILPQAFRKIIPPYTNQLISLVKDSSIISVISVQELTFSGIEVATTTGRLFETLLLVAAMYLAICYPATLLLRRLERPQAARL